LTLYSTTGFILRSLRQLLDMPYQGVQWISSEMIMKRLLLISVISLLFVSGWSRVIAAAFCTDMQDMPGCHMQQAKASTSRHEGHEGMEMGGRQVRSPVVATEANSLEGPMASCCASTPALPPASLEMRGAEQPKKQSGAVLQNAHKALGLPTAISNPPVLSRQHAPPEGSTPRHVLNSVFLV